MENKRGRGRPRAFDRDEVLEKAMQMFWAAGYEAASVPMLTEAMGISAQSLYAAFGSKEALYKEALDRYRVTIGGFAARALDEEADALVAVERVLRDAATTFARTVGTPGCMIATPSTGAAEAELTMLGRTLRAESMERIEQRLARGIAGGQVRADADCAAWARYVGSVVQGMSVQARDGASAESLLAAAQIAALALKTLRPAG
ncbi:TetR/AcrR family transcriptional regulator [Novosphingobium sp. AP12]|uniref:TetR/AcrR family transcriptional regulator n=1 Tax=Novosphingobium sp. AP12 TaxID=1144305 RepID=UPI001930BDC5|nr:TetR/AcrR family transcriptional regulator [Novosphingobium sp. AP12]